MKQKFHSLNEPYNTGYIQNNLYYTEYIKTTRDNMKTNEMNLLKTRNKQKMQITSHNHIKWVLCKKAGTGQIDNNIRDGKIKPDI